MKLGIFDSGIGGEAIAAALRKTFPQAEIQMVNDRLHVPYGDKTTEEITHLTDTAIQPLLDEKCDIIILACNSATAVAIGTLRRRYPQQKFIGIEPMIKPAVSATKSQIIAVCATPATLASDRYNKLVQEYGHGITILEPDCSEWASMIEDDNINHAAIKQIIEDMCFVGADVIILGCTHYHWIKDLIIEITRGRATVLEPSEAIGRRVQHLLNLQ